MGCNDLVLCCFACSVLLAGPLQKEQRKFQSKYVFRDISGNPNKETPVILVDYSGKRRPIRESELKFRSWEPKYRVVRQGTAPGMDTPRKGRRVIG